MKVNSSKFKYSLAFTVVAIAIMLYLVPLNQMGFQFTTAQFNEDGSGNDGETNDNSGNNNNDRETNNNNEEEEDDSSDRESNVRDIINRFTNNNNEEEQSNNEPIDNNPQ